MSKQSRMLWCKKAITLRTFTTTVESYRRNSETIEFVPGIRRRSRDTLHAREKLDEKFKKIFQRMRFRTNVFGLNENMNIHLFVVSTLHRENYNTAEMSVVLIVEKIENRHDSGRFSRLELKIIPCKTSGETCAYS